MLSIVGEAGQSGFYDGLPRRDFLKTGALGVGGLSGLSMPDILRAEAQAGISNSGKSVIMIFLAGGPAHQDMVDLKPDAPLEVRGEFSPIDTNVPGIQICELLPLTARMMDKFALIRSVVCCASNHTAYQYWSGRDIVGQPQGGWPSVGSVLSRLQGSTDGSTPPYVRLVEKCRSIDWRNPGQAGFLDPEYIPFRPTKGGANDVTARRVDARSNSGPTSAAFRFRPHAKLVRNERRRRRNGLLSAAGVQRAHVEQAG
jgi:hypothetical protein